MITGKVLLFHPANDCPHREASDSCKPSAAAVASDERDQKKEQHKKVKFNDPEWDDVKVETSLVSG